MFSSHCFQSCSLFWAAGPLPTSKAASLPLPFPADEIPSRELGLTAGKALAPGTEALRFSRAKPLI